MSTYTKILYQIVFGSKNFTPFLSRVNQDILFNYIAGIVWNKNCKPHIIGGHSNHLHLVIDVHPTISLAFLVKDIKKASHEMMLKEKSTFNRFPGWQVGYGAFTYSHDALESLTSYVKNQFDHHKKVSFKEELLKILQEFDVSYNEKYLLD